MADEEEHPWAHDEVHDGETGPTKRELYDHLQGDDAGKELLSGSKIGTVSAKGLKKINRSVLAALYVKKLAAATAKKVSGRQYYAGRRSPPMSSCAARG